MNVHGIGLGLTISKKIVEQFGGEVSFESHEGEGSTFNFTLKIQNIENGYPAEKDSENKNKIFEMNSEELKIEPNNNYEINIDSLVFNWEPKEVVKPIEFVKNLDRVHSEEDIGKSLRES